jgi:hypothetical protein
VAIKTREHFSSLPGSENGGASENKGGEPQVVSFMRATHGILFRKNNDKRLEMRETGRRVPKKNIMKNNVG